MNNRKESVSRFEREFDESWIETGPCDFRVSFDVRFVCRYAPRSSSNDDTKRERERELRKVGKKRAEWKESRAAFREMVTGRRTPGSARSDKKQGTDAYAHVKVTAVGRGVRACGARLMCLHRVT